MASTMDEQEKQAKKMISTRIFKKTSPSSKITVYIGRRDFITCTQKQTVLVDGIVLVDVEAIKQGLVFAQILVAFRYGREGMDTLAGLYVQKDLYLYSAQVYPQLTDAKPLTEIQEKLIQKLGPNAFPFQFELPSNLPASVTLQPLPGETGVPCGIDYELSAYLMDENQKKMNKKNMVQLMVRKLIYAPESFQGPQPMVEGIKQFKKGSGDLRLEATLDKEKYYHGESISVNAVIDNNSNKMVKKIKVSVVSYIAVIQTTDVMVFAKSTYKFAVAELISEEGCPIQPGQIGVCRVFYLTPLLSNNREKSGLAVDGQLKYEDTNLASSTIFEFFEGENLGINVTYKVKVRLILGFGCSDLSVDLPFTLTHPKPIDMRSDGEKSGNDVVAGNNTDGRLLKGAVAFEDNIDSDMALDTSSITIDSCNGTSCYDGQNDDFVFEEFTRLLIKNDNRYGQSDA